MTLDCVYPAVLRTTRAHTTKLPVDPLSFLTSGLPTTPMSTFNSQTLTHNLVYLMHPRPYVDWLDHLLSLPTSALPLSISTSYGDDEQTVPRAYAIRACRGFAQLGARGVSVIFSSGDWGVGDDNPDLETHECFTNDGEERRRFLPVFPASCP